MHERDLIMERNLVAAHGGVLRSIIYLYLHSKPVFELQTPTPAHLTFLLEHFIGTQKYGQSNLLTFPPNPFELFPPQGLYSI